MVDTFHPPIDIFKFSDYKLKYDLILINQVFKKIVKDRFAGALILNLTRMLSNCGFLMIVEEFPRNEGNVYDSWNSELVRDQAHWTHLIEQLTNVHI